jgi:hypothetical protein
MGGDLTEIINALTLTKQTEQLEQISS